MFRRIIFVTMGIVAFAVGSSGQQFDAAAIRPNKTDNSGTEGRKISIEASPASLTMRNVTLLSCIRWAYSVHDFQIQGGPAWRDSERYDIVAKPAVASTEDQLRLMLRALLADRFKLTLHRQNRETAVYVLTVGKNGHRMTPSKGRGQRGVRPNGSGVSLENATMADLVLFLSSLPPFDRPVLDRTGLAGRFDITLKLRIEAQFEANPAAAKSEAVSGGPVLFMDALGQIGLKIDPQKLPLENIVIDRAEKPAEN
jgi:uncharacterized protein (TIGR03435 family)